MSDHTVELADAEAEAMATEEKIKVVRARLMERHRMSGTKFSREALESLACSDPAYEKAIMVAADARRRRTEARGRAKHMELLWESWRTIQANARVKL